MLFGFYFIIVSGIIIYSLTLYDFVLGSTIIPVVILSLVSRIFINGYKYKNLMRESGKIEEQIEGLNG